MSSELESCPACHHQGWLYPSVIKATGEKVVVCDECEALWKDGEPIVLETSVGMSTYLKSLGLEGTWNELEVEGDLVCPLCRHDCFMHGTMVATGDRIVLCEECHFVWLAGEDLTVDSATDWSAFLEQYRSKGLSTDHTTDRKSSKQRDRSFFNVSSPGEVFRLIDEAWMRRKAPSSHDRGRYVISMGRVVGTKGENAIAIVVQPGTSNVVTAYPTTVAGSEQADPIPITRQISSNLRRAWRALKAWV